MREGDPPGPAYLVRRGRLEVLVDGVRVRELGPGAVIGDLALLTGSPRSASIRARRDAELLEISTEAFDALIDTDSAARRAVLHQLAHRLRTAGGVEASAPTAAAGDRRRRGFRVDHAGRCGGRAAVPDHADGDAQAGVDARTRRCRWPGTRREDAERIVFVRRFAGGRDADWRAFCLRQSDVVVLVVRDTDPPVRPPVAPATQPELVVVGEPPDSRRIAAWVEATDAWQATATASAADAARCCGRSPIVSPGARSVSSSPVAARGRSLTSACCSSWRRRAWSWTASPVRARARSSLRCTRKGDRPPRSRDALYAGFVRRSPFADWTIPVTALMKGLAAQAMMDEGFADEVIEALPRQLRVVSVDLAARKRHVHRRGPLARACSHRTAADRVPAAARRRRHVADRRWGARQPPVDLLLERPEGPVVAVNNLDGRWTSARRCSADRPAAGPDARRDADPDDDDLRRRRRAGRDRTRRAGGHTSHARRGELEYHQIDAMLEAGRAAARVLVEQVLSRVARVELWRQPGAAAEVVPEARPLNFDSGWLDGPRAICASLHKRR